MVKRLIIVLSIIAAFGVVIPAYGQDDVKTYSGQGITLQYPQSWFLFEKEDGIGLSSEKMETEPDVFQVCEGVLKVRILLLNSHDLIVEQETDPTFLLGYYAAVYTQQYFASNLVSAFFDQDIDVQNLELSITLGEIEDISNEKTHIQMVHQTIEYGDAAEFIVILIENSVVLAASAPLGDIEQWHTSILDVARSIEFVSTSP